MYLYLKKPTKEERSKKRHSRAQARQKSSRVAKQARRVLASFARVPRAKALLGSLLTKKKPKTKRGFRIVLELAGTGTKLGVIEVPSVNVDLKTIQQRCIAALKRNPDYHYKGTIFLRKEHGSTLKSVKGWPKDEVIVVQHFIPLNSKEKQLVAKERKYMHDLRDDVRTEKEWKRWVQRRMQYALSFEQYLTLKRHGVYYLAALEAGITGAIAHSSAQIQALRRDTGINPETLETFLARFQKYKRLIGIATSQDLIYVDV